MLARVRWSTNTGHHMPTKPASSNTNNNRTIPNDWLADRFHVHSRLFCIIFFVVRYAMRHSMVIVASLVRYRDHRQKPSTVTMGNAVNRRNHMLRSHHSVWRLFYFVVVVVVFDSQKQNSNYSKPITWLSVLLSARFCRSANTARRK